MKIIIIINHINIYIWYIYIWGVQYIDIYIYCNNNDDNNDKNVV